MEYSFGLAMAALFLACAWYAVRGLEHYVDPIHRLRELSELRESGLLDDKEFEKLRKRQLSRLRWQG